MIDSFSGAHRFLSNFHPCTVEFEGVRYPSTEHAYQAAKVLDDVDRRAIATLTSPGLAKAFGRRVKLRADWEDVKLSVMEKLLRAKFNPKGTDEQKKLAKMLRATGSAKLVEGNTWGDTFWGVCNGKGENHLGRLLMNVRWSLIEEPALHGVMKRKPRRYPAEPVVVKSWAVNPEYDEPSFRAYACGLVIVSLPGALRGPRVEDATPEQLALRERVDGVLNERTETFTDDVLACLVTPRRDR